ncbi:MAG: hypothetical protein ACR2PX_15120 [Endozoicomonas sp.]|uniref:hypothetical protein n=1 Tax=Endozoicomonas sp. TaxID=1892382 RepID=UPI003D9B4AC5
MISKKVLLGAVTLIAPFLALEGRATHTDGYTEYQRSQAIPFTQCHPGQYDHFFYVEKGQDLSVVIKDIIADLSAVTTSASPESSSVASESSTVSSDLSSSIYTSTAISASTLFPSSTGTYSVSSSESVGSSVVSQTQSGGVSSSSLIENDHSSTSVIPSSTPTAPPTESDEQRKKRQAEQDQPARIQKLVSMKKWPPEPKTVRAKRHHDSQAKPDHRVLILLEGGIPQTYTLSSQLELNRVTLGICTKPPASVPDDKAIPVADQAVIKITDSTFPSREHPALVINDGMKLNLESVQVDAHDWSSNNPVLLFLDRSRGVINNSSLIRLKDNGDDYDWGWDWFDYRSTIHMNWWLGTGVPEVTITDSRLYQGMALGANIFGKYGGKITVENTEQVIARTGISLNLCSAELNVIKGSMSGCSEPVSLEAFANMESLPATGAEFCPQPGDQSSSCAYYGWDNLVNFQQSVVKGSWYVALNFCDDRLKVQGVQNMGNQEEMSAGELCSGYLAYGAEGAVGFAGRASCPPGSQFASTQTQIEPATEPGIVVNLESADPNSGSGLVGSVVGVVFAVIFAVAALN